MADTDNKKEKTIVEPVYKGKIKIDVIIGSRYYKWEYKDTLNEFLNDPNNNFEELKKQKGSNITNEEIERFIFELDPTRILVGPEMCHKEGIRAKLEIYPEGCPPSKRRIFYLVDESEYVKRDQTPGSCES